MKKALAWIFLSMIGLAALALTDLEARARKAIDAHASKLREDIAALRARTRVPRPGADLDFRMPILEDFDCPISLWQGVDGDYPRFEQGHRGQAEAFQRLKRPRGGPPLQRAYAEEALTAMVMSETVFREGGYEAALARERGAALQLLHPENLRHEDTAIEDYRLLSDALDQLAAGRRSLAEIITAEYALDRADILAGRGVVADWRDLFLPSVRTARMLDRLKEHYRAAIAFVSAPHDRWQALRVTNCRLEGDDLVPWSVLRSWAFDAATAQCRRLDGWQGVRIELAVALYREEMGCDLVTLEELVPEYLPAIPLSAEWGRPYEWRDGALRVTGVEEFDPPQ